MPESPVAPTSTTAQDIVIPTSLLPTDGRFGAGPSKVRKDQVDALASRWNNLLGTSHRQSTVRAEVARLRRGLRQLFSLPDEYEVVLGNGGSTAFWEVATFGLIQERSEHLSFGEFGSKFAKATASAPFLADPIVVTSDPGDAPTWQPHPEVDVYASPHNETSTGVAIDVARVPAPEALMLWDATSAAAGLAVEASEFDVYYFAPQKAFGSDGGLWIALMSPAALRRAAQIDESDRYIPEFLRVQTAIENSRKEQTYNTPSLATIYLMAEQIDWFNSNGGLTFSTGRSTASAEILYAWAEQTSFTSPYVRDPAKRSNVIGTIDFSDDIDAATLTAVLRSNGIVDTEPYRKLGRNQLRVAMFPAIEPADVAALTACIDHVVTRMS